VSRRWTAYPVIGLFVLTLAFVGLAVADDPKEDPDEPPVRLKKKVRPNKDKDVDKKDKDKEVDRNPTDRPPRKDGEAKKDGDAKKPVGKNPARPGEDRKKLVRRVLKNMKTSEDRLAKHDPGKSTRKIQKEILKDLDALIEQTRQNPPPQRRPPRQSSRRRQQKPQNQRNAQNNPNRSNPNQEAKNPNQGSDKNRGGGNNSKKKDSKDPNGRYTRIMNLPEKDRLLIDEYMKAGYIPKYKRKQQAVDRKLAEMGSQNQGD
jgi:hypothetical protein